MSKSKTNKKAPCPCGSGKIYKRCCLRKVPQEPKIEHIEETENKNVTKIFKKNNYNEQLNAIIESPLQPYVPKKEMMASYKELVQDLNEYLDSGEVDNENIFDFFNDLSVYVQIPEQFDEFFALMEKVKTQYPDIYSKETKYFVWFTLDAKFQQAQYTEAKAWFLEFAKHCEGDLDIFYPELNRILHLCFFDTALKGIEILFEDTLKDSEFAYYVQHGLRIKYCTILCYHEYLTSNGATTKEAILEKTARFKLEEDAEHFKSEKEMYDLRTLNALFDNSGLSPSEHIETNLSALKEKEDLLGETTPKVLNAFLWYLLSQQTIPKAAGFIYWNEISTYLFEKGKRKNKTKISSLPQKSNQNFLYPEKTSVERYIQLECQNKTHYLSREPFEVISALHAMLLWFDFLYVHNLTKKEPLHFLNEMARIFVLIYNIISVDATKQAETVKAKELLTALQQTIQKHETTTQDVVTH